MIETPTNTKTELIRRRMINSSLRIQFLMGCNPNGWILY
jgi:hypothetical protein